MAWRREPFHGNRFCRIRLLRALGSIVRRHGPAALASRPDPGGTVRRHAYDNRANRQSAAALGGSEMIRLAQVGLRSAPSSRRVLGVTAVSGKEDSTTTASMVGVWPPSPTTAPTTWPGTTCSRTTGSRGLSLKRCRWPDRPGAAHTRRPNPWSTTAARVLVAHLAADLVDPVRMIE